jgi:hypothetical protein
MRARSASASTSWRAGRNSCSGGSNSRIVTLHRLEQALEVALLERQQILEPLAALLGVRAEDDGDHLLVAVVAEEHVLGAAQADAGRAELARALGVVGGVGVRADLERAQLV